MSSCLGENVLGKDIIYKNIEGGYIIIMLIVYKK